MLTSSATVLCLILILPGKQAQAQDSLKAIKGRSQSAIDSVKRIGDSLAQVQTLKLQNKKLDGAKRKAGSLNQTLAKTVSGKPDSLQQGIQNRLERIAIPNSIGDKSDSLAGKARGIATNLQEKASEGSKILSQGNALNIPGASAPDLSGATVLPALGKELPASSLPLVSQPLSGTSLPADKADVTLPKTGTDLASPQVPTTKLQELPSATIPVIDPKLDAKSLTGVEGITRNLNKSPDSVAIEVLSQVPEVDPVKVTDVAGGLQEAKRYRTQLDSADLMAIGENGADELESRVTETAEMRELNQQRDKMLALKARQEAMLERYRDKRRLQEEISRKMRNVVNEQLNQFTPEFTSAQDQIGKTKRLNPAVQSVKEMVRKRPNEMKERPLRERLVPGLALQAYNSEPFSMDFGPQLGYRLTGRLTGGLGAVIRASFGSSNSFFVQSQGVFGAKNYLDWEALRSYLIHAEFEYLSIDKDAFQPSLETASPYTLASYVGLGRRFALSRKINVTTAVLYRFEFSGHLPGQSPVNLRVMFDLRQKRKVSVPK